jgi:hypothetical protein
MPAVYRVRVTMDEPEEKHLSTEHVHHGLHDILFPNAQAINSLITTARITFSNTTNPSDGTLTV